MGPLALLLAVVSSAALVVPSPGMFVAMGLGIFAVGTGLVGYRRRTDRSSARLAGAAAIAIGGLSVALALTKYGVTLAAISRIQAMIS